MTEQEMQFELMKSQDEVNALRQGVSAMNKEREYWQHYRIQASIQALGGLTSNPNFERHTLEDVIAECVTLADALIAELQKKGGQNETAK